MQLQITLTNKAGNTTFKDNSQCYYNGNRIYDNTPLDKNNFLGLSEYYKALHYITRDIVILVDTVNAANDPAFTIVDIANTVTMYIDTHFGDNIPHTTIKEYSRYKLSLSFISCIITIEYR